MAEVDLEGERELKRGSPRALHGAEHVSLAVTHAASSAQAPPRSQGCQGYARNHRGKTEGSGKERGVAHIMGSCTELNVLLFIIRVQEQTGAQI